MSEENSTTKRTKWQDSDTHKQCRHCEEVKLRSEFGLANKSKDKLHIYCTACSSVRSKAWYAANRERVRESARNYREQNSERLSAKRREYYLQNKVRENQMSREYYQRNRDQIIERMKEYRESNPAYFDQWKKDNNAKVRAQRDRRRARLRGAEGEYTPQDVWDMLESQGHLCCYCEQPLEGVFHVDHLVPLSRRGSNGWENVAVSCPPCNMRKFTMTAEEFVNQK